MIPWIGSILLGFNFEMRWPGKANQAKHETGRRRAERYVISQPDRQAENQVVAVPVPPVLMQEKEHQDGQVDRKLSHGFFSRSAPVNLERLESAASFAS